jgi:hypothetical protein
MHPADIHAAIRKAGHSLISVGQQVRGRHGKPVGGGAVWNVVHGRSKSRAIASVIESITGIPADQVLNVAPAVEPLGRPHYRLRLDGTREQLSVRRC